MSDSSENPGERIAKVMARAGVASRREAEVFILAGRVSVNGAVITSPALNVTGRDVIAVDGEPLRLRERTRLFLYHKIPGLVTSHHDPQGRPTIFSALPKHLPRLISVGRLDINTEGLLLLTNDGELARALELPATAWLRRYRVRAYGRIAQERLDTLRKGITVDGVHYGPIEAVLEREQGANVWLSFAIREGKNREIRNVARALDLQVNRLIRISFGPFELGDLPDGAVAEIETEELKVLLGPEVIAKAKPDFDGPIIDHAAVAEAAIIEERRRQRQDQREEERRQKSKQRFSTSARNNPHAGNFKPHRRRGDEDDKASAERDQKGDTKPGAKYGTKYNTKPSRGRRDRSRSGPRPSRPR